MASNIYLTNKAIKSIILDLCAKLCYSVKKLENSIMKNLLGAISFGLGVALMEHAFIQMAEHKDMFRLDSFDSWIVIGPLLAFGVFSFFSEDSKHEADNG